MSVLYPKRRKPRRGDHIRFHIMPWWGMKPGHIYEGTVVDVCYPKGKRYGYYGSLRLKNGTLELGLRYKVDTVVGGQHLDDAIVLDSEIIRIIETKPHAHKAKISQRRLKVYQRRAGTKDYYDQIADDFLQSISIRLPEWTEALKSIGVSNKFLDWQDSLIAGWKRNNE